MAPTSPPWTACRGDVPATTTRPSLTCFRPIRQLMVRRCPGPSGPRSATRGPARSSGRALRPPRHAGRVRGVPGSLPPADSQPSHPSIRVRRPILATRMASDADVWVSSHHSGERLRRPPAQISPEGGRHDHSPRRLIVVASVCRFSPLRLWNAKHCAPPTALRRDILRRCIVFPSQPSTLPDGRRLRPSCIGQFPNLFQLFAQVFRRRSQWHPPCGGAAPRTDCQPSR